MPTPPAFLFVTCHVGAGPALKAEMSRLWPTLKFAYSRPGYLTYKIPEPAENPLTLLNRLELRSVFARASGYSLGHVKGETLQERSAKAWELFADRSAGALHVWERDRVPVGERGFEPGPTPAALESREALLAAAPGELKLAEGDRPAGRGQTVLDCVLVEPDVWGIGYHRVNDFHSRWPGGVMPIALPADAVSRAYLKMEESLAWARLPIEAGDACVELGAAPGGASQALLSHGLRVAGIDPADVDPAVLAHPNFQHVRARGADLKRREFSSIRWLMADMNVAPGYTLDAVESIVTHRDVHLRGLLLTLKLLDWNLAEDIPAWCARVRGWGFQEVRVRQLAHNRQEVCLAALKNRALRRLGRGNTKKTRPRK